MKRTRKITGILLSLLLIISLFGCNSNNGNNPSSTAASAADNNKPVAIVYTNDVHGYIANEVNKGTSDNPQYEKGMRLSKVAQLVSDLRQEGKIVYLVDAGDNLQGNTYASYDKGESIINLMNAAGYSAATIGNHDFNYGVDRFLELSEKADFQYYACNLKSTVSEHIGRIVDAGTIHIEGSPRIGFIGILTPDTITSSTPRLFQNEAGEFIYTVDGTAKPEDLYKSVQEGIDMISDKADIIIALSHLGIGQESIKNKTSSRDVIANTTGLSAVIDGHSHTKLESELVKDKSGKEILLTQNEAYLGSVGLMEIDTSGRITARLISEYENENKAVAELEDKLIQTIKDELGKKVATTDISFSVSNPENEKQRLIRAVEMNIGDLTADAIYWYFNQSKQLDCDIAVENGGGIRSDIKKGDITLQNIKDVEPFGNQVCMINATGQQIKDALELGSRLIGEWDNEWNSPKENGGFLQVAGMQYTIDGTIPSGVKLDDNGMFKSVEGQYRVKDIKVYNKTSGQYEPIDLNKSYTVAGLNYILNNSGNGMSMFAKCDRVVDYVGQDCDILREYIESFKDGDGTIKLSTKNSPLSSYKGYMINYENPYGAERIQQILK